MTLTLDPDVAAMLEKLRGQRKLGLEELVNEALRAAFSGSTGLPRPRERVQTRVVSLGRCLISSLDDVTAALAVAEGDHPSPPPSPAGRGS